jgi:Flp pilus assembly pilin Flp
MINILKNFVREEQGQDLVEYTLLLAFVCLASAAIFTGVGTGLASIWSGTSKVVTNAETAAFPS